MNTFINKGQVQSRSSSRLMAATSYAKYARLSQYSCAKLALDQPSRYIQLFQRLHAMPVSSFPLHCGTADYNQSQTKQASRHQGWQLLVFLESKQKAQLAYATKLVHILLMLLGVLLTQHETRSKACITCKQIIWFEINRHSHTVIFGDDVEMFIDLFLGH